MSAATVTTSELTVTEAHIVAWASLTGDWLPIHMSREHAERSSYGARLVHGPLTQSLAIGLSTRTPLIDPERTLAWLGLRELQAIEPVYVDDTIHAVVTRTVSRPTRRPGRRVVELSYDVRNQDDVQVMSFVSVLLVADQDE